MTDLEKSPNLYADLAQSSYVGRPEPLPYSELKPYDKKKIDSVKSVKINYGKPAGKVYLQPDPTVKTIEEIRTIQVPKANGGYETKSYVHGTSQKGLLTDTKAGYNSYFVTDTPKVNNKTQNTYFVTRGSDAAGLDTMNDWWTNNAQFTLKNAHIPQAKLATKAMHEKIKELSKSAPNAKMNITGHSLGTMVSIQAVVNLSASDIDKIGRIVLFQGPDARESINKMSKQARENLKKLEEAWKIDYYVNPFDLVSMLNRNKKGIDEIGNVLYMLPKSYTNTFDLKANNGSSHDFGQYQIDANGNIQLANVKDNPELFAAANELSAYIDKTLDNLGGILGLGTVTTLAIFSAISSGGTNVVADIVALAGGVLTYNQAKKIYRDYVAIIKKAQVERERNQKIQHLQSKIQSASGSQKIQLQEELVREVALQATAFGEEYESIVTTILEEAEDEINQIVKEVEEAAWTIQHYLSISEVDAMIANFKKEALWDAVEAAAIKKQTKAYHQKLTDISNDLSSAATSIKNADNKAAKLFQVKK